LRQRDGPARLPPAAAVGGPRHLIRHAPPAAGRLRTFPAGRVPHRSADRHGKRPLSPFRRALMLALALALVGCTGLAAPTPTPTIPVVPTATPATPDPQGTAATFLEAWQAGDYGGMYSLLSPLSQDAISQSDFQARYEAVA